VRVARRDRRSPTANGGVGDGRQGGAFRVAVVGVEFEQETNENRE
jgi:hypothetical protein